MFAGSLVSNGARVAIVQSAAHPFGYRSLEHPNIERWEWRNYDDIIQVARSFRPDIFWNMALTGGSPKTLSKLFDYIRAMGIKIVISNHGSDSRLSCISDTLYYLKSIYRTNFSEYPEAMAADVSLRSEYVKIADSADLVIDNPTSWHLHNKEYYNSLFIGLPQVTRMQANAAIKQMKWKRAVKAESNRISFLHLPSNPLAKGTHDIIRTFYSHSGRGCTTSSLLAFPPQRVSNSRCLRLLDKSDVLIDQIYSDTYTASLAMEALVRGVVPIVCGNAVGHSSFLKSMLPNGLVPPVIHGSPAELNECINKAAEYTSNSGLPQRYMHSLEQWLHFYSLEEVGNRLVSLFSHLLDGKQFMHGSHEWVIPWEQSYTQVHFMPDRLFARLASQGFYSLSIDTLVKCGHSRAAECLQAYIDSLRYTSN